MSSVYQVSGQHNRIWVKIPKHAGAVVNRQKHISDRPDKEIQLISL